MGIGGWGSGFDRGSGMGWAWRIIGGLLATVAALLSNPSLQAQWSSFSIDVSNPVGEYPIGTAIPSLCPIRVSMRVSPMFLASAGYQSVAFRVRPATGRTFPSDGIATVQLHFDAYGTGNRTAVFQIPVRVGESEAESMMLIQCPRGHANMRVQTDWNGASFAHLSSSGYVSWSPVFDTRFSPSRLFIATSNSTWMDVAMRKGHRTLREPEMTIACAEDFSLKNPNSLNSNPQWRNYVTDVDLVSDEWLQLSSLDQVCTSVSELQALNESRLAALNQYLWCGGTVCILDDVGPDEVNKWIRAEWDRSTLNKELNSQVYRAGFGSVVLLHKRGRADLDKLESRNRAERLSGVLRDEYWNWLIPKIGKTPVWTFFGIVVLLVGIGAPAILIWSQRIQRRIWTVLAIPILSLVSVLSLFAYGTIKDGWTSLVRVRSLTLLDAEGNGAVWSRQTYFAGSLPGGKIRLASNVELVPLRSRNLTDMVQFQDETEQIYSGILSVRRQNQVSVAHPVQGVKLLRMATQTSGEEGPPATKNESELNLLGVVCCDAAGRVYRAADTPPGGIVKWEETSPEDAAKWLNQFYNAQPLQIPVDAPDDRSVSIFGFFRPGSVTWSPGGVGFSEITEEAEWTSRISEWGAATPRKFVAVVDRAPKLEKCLPEAKETSSLHMVVGRW